MATGPRAQPFRIDWPVSDAPIEPRLAQQFESIDQMFQTVFEDLAGLNTSVTAVSGTSSTGVSMAKVLTRVVVRN